MSKSRQIDIINGQVPEITIKGRVDIIFLMYLCESQETFRYMLDDIEALVDGSDSDIDIATERVGFEISIEKSWNFYEKYINSKTPGQYEIDRIVELCNTTHSRAIAYIEWLEQNL